MEQGAPTHERINIGRAGGRSAESPHVSIPQIVSEHDHEVRPRCLHPHRRLMAEAADLTSPGRATSAVATAAGAKDTRCGDGAQQQP